LDFDFFGNRLETHGAGKVIAIALAKSRKK
jgi:hypothetical protein